MFFDIFIGVKLFRYVTAETPRILNVLTGKFISDICYVWVFNRFSLLKVSSWLRESVSPDTIATVVLEAKRNRTLMSSCLVDGLRNCKVNMRQSIFIDLLFNLISQGFTAMGLSVAIEILKLHNFYQVPVVTIKLERRNQNSLFVRTIMWRSQTSTDSSLTHFQQ